MKLAWPWQSGVLDPHGPIGAAERTILLDSTAIMLAVIVPVIVLTLVFAWWFRSGNPKATRLPDWSYSGRIEVIVWSIPTLTIGFLGGIAWLGSHDLDPRAAISSDVPPVQVQVVGDGLEMAVHLSRPACRQRQPARRPDGRADKLLSSPRPV